MAFEKLERFEKERAKVYVAAAEERVRADLKRAVKEVLPKRLKKPTRPRGRTAAGGLSRKEVAQLRAKAKRFLDGAVGMQELEVEVQHTALVILMIDGVMGTEPWRAAHHAHGGLISANARLRYLENAGRLLEDLRRSHGGSEPKLLEGVIDAEPAE